jgi:hypothetical protein
MRRASWINVLIGMWLIVSPWVLGFTSWAATSNHVLFGFLVAILAVSSAVIARRVHALSWVNAAFGGWLVMSPWLLGYVDAGVAGVNSMIAGVAVALIALLRVGERSRRRAPA